MPRDNTVMKRKSLQKKIAPKILRLEPRNYISVILIVFLRHDVNLRFDRTESLDRGRVTSLLTAPSRQVTKPCEFQLPKTTTKVHNRWVLFSWSLSQ